MHERVSKHLSTIISLAENNWRPMEFGKSGQDTEWLKGIESEAGWYFIKTTAPLIAFTRCIRPFESDDLPADESEDEDAEEDEDQGDNGGGTAAEKKKKTEKRIDLPVRIHQTRWLADLRMSVPVDPKGYIVYNGEAKSVLSRLRQHYKGSSGTGCISISTYAELRKYKWWVSFVYVKDVFKNSRPSGDREAALRVTLEQAWRAKNGWPRLCLDVHKPAGRKEFDGMEQ